ncbi:MAG: hypothetical protein Q8Q18_03765 [bacterium]|nr:hypothetical protein [bacterium]
MSDKSSMKKRFFERCSFLWQALRHPATVGAIAPSSKRLARLIVQEARLASAKVVVELGSGTGALTDVILENIGANGSFVGIETNEAFVSLLRDKYPEAVFCNGSASNISRYLSELGFGLPERIISGIPWTALDTSLQESLLHSISEALVPQGLFLTFAYFPLNHLPRGRAFEKKLQVYFKTVRKTRVVPNTLPAFVYVCTK